MTLLLFTGLSLAPYAASDTYLLSLLTRVMVIAIAAVALDFLLGYAGLLSFGHAAFIGVGAYAVGILASYGVTDLLVQVAAAVAGAIVIGGCTGFVALRTQGVYFIMITLAFAQMLFFLATSLSSFGGDDGMSLASRSTVLGSPVLERQLPFYYLVLACLVATYGLCRTILRSRFGRVLEGLRENTQRLLAIGYDAPRFALVAYVFAGALAAVAGVLLANNTRFVSPAYMTWHRSGELIVMILLGGPRSLQGAIIGAGVYVLLAEYLSGLTEHWGMIFGALLVLTVFFAKGGLLALLGRAPR